MMVNEDAKMVETMIDIVFGFYIVNVVGPVETRVPWAYPRQHLTRRKKFS